MTIGIDEVGRGCWAGPVVACAVELSNDSAISGLRDSKKLSKKQRESLDEAIRDSATQIGLGWVWPKEINTLGLTESVRLAMQRAVDELELSDQEVIIDGNYNFLHHVPQTKAVIKADDSVPSVAAASIVAKVARDSYMTELSKKHAHYGFESHVGYGTKQHVDALKSLGVLHDIHRLKYNPIQRILAGEY